MRSKKYIFGLAIIWTVLVTVLSLITIGSDVGRSINIPNKDKIVHFTFYFVFVLLWITTFKHKINWIFIFFGAVLYGLLMEFLQGFTKTRTPDFYDFIANSSGALSALVLAKYFFKPKSH